MSMAIETSPTARIDLGERPPRSTDPGFLADSWNVMVRELRPVFREPASVLFAMVQPLVFLGLFAPLLPEVEDGSALQWFVPGIIAMTALMGASFTGANLTQEIMTGSHERLLVSPLSRSSLMVGRSMK
jgi:ABC-2 type transport system permease protein